ncbi:DUF202 domain-containing protein [Candidatus Roizmanbacteria bacterium]|nr:DUF202 domain-containing protein [Candidatus Roizmanbacteria bacterium]
MNDLLKDIPSKKFTVRDILAINRTVLANERTFLAYARTSINFLLVGISLLKFFDSLATQAVGYLFLFGSMFVGIYGVSKYDSMRRLIIEEQNVRQARDISETHDNGMIRVPKAMWNMVQKAYVRLNPLEK